MSARPKLLDLFAGAGGCTRGYQLAGFHVTGVDLVASPNYVGDEFFQGDALTFPLDGYDVIHASPPCQFATAYKRRAGVAERVVNLIPATRERLEDWGRVYVIENVEQAGPSLRNPVRLCGKPSGSTCSVIDCSSPTSRYWSRRAITAGSARGSPQATNRQNLRRTVEVGSYRCAHLSPAAMGIDWMTNDEISQAIPPVYTKFIGEQLLAALDPATVPDAPRVAGGIVTEPRIP